MLTYQDLNIPKKLGECLSISANDIIKLMHTPINTFIGSELKLNKIQVDITPEMIVHLEILNADTVKFTMVNHEVLLQGDHTPIWYLDKHVSRYDSTLVGPIAHRIAMTLNLLVNK